jgi:hypothetical protein
MVDLRLARPVGDYARLLLSFLTAAEVYSHCCSRTTEMTAEHPGLKACAQPVRPDSPTRPWESDVWTGFPTRGGVPATERSITFLLVRLLKGQWCELIISCRRLISKARSLYKVNPCCTDCCRLAAERTHLFKASVDLPVLNHIEMIYCRPHGFVCKFRRINTL